MAIPARYQAQKWAKSTTSALTRARKSASEARKKTSSPTAILAGTAPGAFTVVGTGFLDERYGNVIPIGDGGLSATEVAAIALPVLAIATGSAMVARASAGPITVAAYLAGRKLAQKMQG